MTRICMIGVSGWTGKAITRGIVDADDLALTAAVARRSAGSDAGVAAELGCETGVTCVGSFAEALDTSEFDVVIDYTAPDIVMDHALAAIAAGKHFVIGTSGLGKDQFAKIAAAAEAAGVGVVAAGNFSLTGALMARFSLMAAKYLDHFEVLDFAKYSKPDAPSGTARELAERLGDVKQPAIGHPLDEIIGERELRGGTINGVQVHSIRLPSYSATVTSQFATAGSRLMITHDAAGDAGIYVDGTLLAARKAAGIKGLVRGLDNLLD